MLKWKVKPEVDIDNFIASEECPAKQSKCKCISSGVEATTVVNIVISSNGNSAHLDDLYNPAPSLNSDSGAFKVTNPDHSTLPPQGPMASLLPNLDRDLSDTELSSLLLSLNLVTKMTCSVTHEETSMKRLMAIVKNPL